MTPLPISVLVPTCNCAALLRHHLESMKGWLDLAEEVVAVDSFSTDGTKEILKTQLCHKHLLFCDHPRGLYQSWNFGIQQLRAKYAYISTIGDTITAEGLRHLVAVAEEIGSDVVISRPEFVSPEGVPFNPRHWPIHRFLQRCPIMGPVRLDPWHVLLLAMLDVPEGMPGSSASNLYRADTLKRFPFPTDYGHAGDTAWGIRHAFHISLAVTPRIFSRFMLHAPVSELGGDATRELTGRMLELAREAVAEFMAKSSKGAVPQRVQSLLGLLVDMQKLLALQACYDKARHAVWPWSLNPAGWKARSARNRQRKLVRAATASVCKEFGFPPTVGSGPQK